MTVLIIGKVEVIFMNNSNRLLCVTEKLCPFCAVMNEVLITIYVNLTTCVQDISAAAHSVVSVRNDPTVHRAKESTVAYVTKYVHGR
jgi:hypothetical protein